MHADTATRQHWMSVLAHSQPAELAARVTSRFFLGYLTRNSGRGARSQKAQN